ncbi:hypothetical protein BV898_04339 [Hypsibius exemplaris]|uniref:Uncharacterized protein n=1 Tax=Hypsibius exemplaris TaxID=2072580 RepID=A0A1W0X3A1_HYPEX|nr:hypothetical protein BV898_04339 [Hypsibius exemplaris]
MMVPPFNTHSRPLVRQSSFADTVSVYAIPPSARPHGRDSFHEPPEAARSHGHRPKVRRQPSRETLLDHQFDCPNGYHPPPMIHHQQHRNTLSPRQSSQEGPPEAALIVDLPPLEHPSVSHIRQSRNSPARQASQERLDLGPLFLPPPPAYSVPPPPPPPPRPQSPPPSFSTVCSRRNSAESIWSLPPPYSAT